MKVLKVFLITVGVIIVLAVASVLVVLNLTPNQLGLGEMEISEGYSLNGLGLGDTKVITIIRNIKDVLTPDEAAILTNTPNDEEEASNVEANFDNANVPTKENGETDYISLLTDELVYDDEYLIEYKDTTLCYIFDQVIAQGTESSDESIKFLKDLDGSIESFTISLNTDNTTYTARTVVGLDTESYKKAIEDNLGDAKSYVTIPQRVYLVSYLNLSADATGKLVTTHQNIVINDNDSPVSQAIFKVLVSAASSNAEDGELNELIGDALETIVSNLGSVGSASIDSDNKVTGDKVLGSGGIKQHALTLITHTS